MIVGAFMKSKWESMTIDELFALREQMQEVLTVKIVAEKTTLEHRLCRLSTNDRQRSLRCLSLLAKCAIRVRQTHP